ncbi:GGDEF domain-containing protein [Aneurinibacillus sp. BA2021]|nr:GGDEF domain-containing protein [Aneurinibacillus sp. BA2021]
MTAIISFAISYTFYSYKQKEFIHQAERKENEIHLQKLFDVSTLYKNPEERTALLQEVTRLGSIKNYMMEQKELSGETRWVMANCELIEYKNETCMLTGVTDITEIKKMENELAKHASTDMLTGIMNRRSGMDILQAALAKAQYEETVFTVCFIDVNNLKMVNDTYGHPEGDDLVLNVSRVIQGELTPSDVFFRFGGDEFIVIFFEKTPADVQTIWENITRAFQTFNEAGKKPYLLSVSHGFYHYVSGMDVSVDDMIGQADKEMYEQKKKSKAGR